jgi:starvation-inducible outer membrane lipoprotein
VAQKIICSLIAGLFFFLSGCNITPGQIRKTTGESPVSIELGGEIELKGEYNHGLNKKK